MALATTPSADQLSLILDLVLLAAVVLLAAIWLRNAARQKRLEQLLSGTAAQLEEASRLLEQAGEQLRAARSAEATEKPVSRDGTTAPPSQATPMKQQAEKITPRAAARKAYGGPAPQYGSRAATPTQAGTASAGQAERTAMVLRLHREGVSVERIAEKLDMPLAQVRLLLKLQQAARA